MSQDVRPESPRVPEGDGPDAAIADDSAPEATPDAATPATDDTTVGTGSVIALGCIAGTLLLILIGLLYLGITVLL